VRGRRGISGFEFGQPNAQPVIPQEHQPLQARACSTPSGQPERPASDLARLVEVWPQFFPAVQAAIVSAVEAARRVS